MTCGTAGRAEKRRLALFDFDGTIVSNDSLMGFAKYCFGWPKVATAIVKSLITIIAWMARVKSNSYAKERLFGHMFRGMSMKDFCAKGEEYASEIERHLNPAIMERLHSHVAHGDRVLIVTASIPQWILPWAHTKGIEAVIGTEAEINAAGNLTGHFSTPNCYGKEKTARIIAAYPDIDEWEVWAYGDSRGDREMLALADRSMMVKHNGQLTEINTL